MNSMLATIVKDTIFCFRSISYLNKPMWGSGWGVKKLTNPAHFFKVSTMYTKLI